MIACTSVCLPRGDGVRRGAIVGRGDLELDPARGRATGYLIHMQMMAMFGHARARSEAEFRSLFDLSGFVLQRVIPMHADWRADRDFSLAR